MIQSDIFDSADMDINKLSNSILNFIKKKINRNLRSDYINFRNSTFVIFNILLA